MGRKLGKKKIKPGGQYMGEARGGGCHGKNKCGNKINLPEIQEHWNIKWGGKP